MSIIKKNFIAPIYIWGSTSSRLVPLRGGSLLFTTKFPEVPDILILSQTNDDNDAMTPLAENHLPMMTSTCNPVRQDIKVQGKKVYSFSRRQGPNMHCFFFGKYFSHLAYFMTLVALYLSILKQVNA